MQRQFSTKREALDQASKVAEDWYLTLQGKFRAGVLEVGPTFKKAADQFLKEYGVITEGERSEKWTKSHAIKFMETGTVGNIGRNGTVLEITVIDAAGLTLKTIAGREGVVAWETLRDESSGKIQLAYGDALTTNIAQGTTVTEHIHAMPGGSRLVSAFGAYTSGSRHRKQSFIVTSEGAERAEIIGRRPLGDRREIAASDVLANVTRNLSRQDEKESAISLVERAVDLRRGTIRTVQAA